MLARGRERPAAQVFERGVVDGDHPGPRAGLDRHVADRHPAFHRQRADRAAAEFDGVPAPARRADPADRGQHEVLGGDAGRQPAVGADQHRFRLLDQQALRRQDVLDLRSADAEGKRRERAVRAGVRIAADDRHPRQRRALLGADHVDDALPLVAERKIRLGAVRADVGVERLDLGPRDRIADAGVPVLGRRVVVGRGDDRADAPRRAARELQSFVGLRTGDLVDEMAIDVQERRAVGLRADDVAVPKLVVERARWHGHQVRLSASSRRFSGNRKLSHE